jgi:hypothetical protein
MPKVWEDFIRLDDVEKPAKQGSGRTERFARWACPHCAAVIEALEKDAIDKKAMVCARHFWGCKPCPKRPENDMRGQPKRKDLEERLAAMEEREKRAEEERGRVEQRLQRAEERERLLSETAMHLSTQLRHYKAKGAELSMSSSHNTLSLPINELAFGREFVLRSLQSDVLLRQLSSPKRAVLQLVDLYAHAHTINKDQLELFKKAFSSMGASAAMSVVQRCYGDTVDPVLSRLCASVQAMERDMPDLQEYAKSNAAEEALCLMHLHNACRRVDVKPLSREGFSALFLGEYEEVRRRFAGYKTVSRVEMRRFLTEEAEGKVFWLALCRRCGLPQAAYDAAIYQIEHLLNSSWGGKDHYLNYLVLFTTLNNSAEFRYGPGEVKMIIVGSHKYRFIQRFNKWATTVSSDTPLDGFLKIESEHYALPAICITGSRQLDIKDCLRGKRQRT